MELTPKIIRAARAMLGETQETLAKKADVERRMIIRLETQGYLRPPEASYKLKRFFETSGVVFLEPTPKMGEGVRWRSAEVDYIRRGQLYAARVLSNLQQSDLAKAAHVDRSTLSRFEGGKTKAPAPDFIKSISDALTKSGKVVLLPATDTEGYGVRIAMEEASDAATD
jgi:transcriptional regulator with XRE-family HTH domain